MKNVIFILVSALMLFTTGNLNAQPGTNKMASAESPTPANVLKWTKEVLPKMERLVPKLEKIKADHKGQQAGMDGIKYLITVSHLKEIKAKGTKLKAAEAKKYYDLIAATVNSFYIECKSQNNNVCCVDCQNHGILGIWCFANCFVARFPGVD